MNRKVILIIFAAFAATACGKKETLELGEFAPYVARFEQVSNQVGAPVQVTELIVQFGKMQSANENGACEIVGDATPTITINQKVWDQMDELERESLIFHELGHCVLRRNHRKEVSQNGVPVSIMNPYRIDAHLYAENEDQYHHELFQVKFEF